VFVAAPTPAIRSPIDVLMVTTMTSVDCEQYDMLGCNYCQLLKSAILTSPLNSFCNTSAN